ncbi:M10 family metallopeptidase [Microcoleus sp. FACHB-672]|uniref:M10 family metallopeptidase n=1 Tax=Microcoleus sp. FACHB-672 TaxID=2692825 RepID=UPI0019C40AC8|nr:M10 family metallopeptidase [Microcoleus sp. FACHB-672]MBD2041095.1 M10 family metallopeptidase C-terminal domain-containing protein [Microcoleus sp. FACHB-672]
MPTAVLQPVEPQITINIFDADFYRGNYSDLADFSDEAAREHFEQHGLEEGRRFSPFFDVEFYGRTNPDLANLSNRALVVHFQDIGIREGRDPSPFFSYEDYRRFNPDLVEADLDDQALFEHYLENGVREGRVASTLFDPNYYRQNSPDLVAAGLNNQELLFHYANYGINEGRRASLVFDPQYYLNTNQDLATQNFNFRQAFEHYVEYGANENRQPSIFYDEEAINALILPNKRWDVPKGGTLTYSFVTTSSAFQYPGEEGAVGEVNDAIKNNVRKIMQEYDKVLPFDVVEVPDRPPNEGQIRIMFSDGKGTPNFYAYSSGPAEGIGGDLHLSRDFETNPNAFSAGPGSFGYETLVHELGHAFGLKHPNNYQESPPNNPDEADGVEEEEQVQGEDQEPYLSFPKDNNTNTAMSSNFAGAGASTPMAYDSRALQFIYGISDYNSGNTTYQFDSNNFLGVKQSIWDAGGNDTFNFSALPATESYFIDINPGGHNTTTSALNGATYVASSDPSRANYPTDIFATTIAYAAIIENVVGSPGNDLIFGNEVGNTISANEGADRLTGASGADNLTGGAGTDAFVFARGDGGLTAGAADTITDFKDGEDLLGLSSGLAFNNILIEGAGADTFIRVAQDGEFLAKLTGISFETITSADFTLI